MTAGKKDLDFLLSTQSEAAGFWKQVQMKDQVPNRKDTGNDGAVGIYDYSDKICQYQETRKPMPVGGSMRGSMWYKICPRNEVIKTWKNQIAYEDMSLRQQLIFETGRVVERIWRKAFFWSIPLL